MEHNKVHKFYESIRSRMLVAEVIERIRAGGKGTNGGGEDERPEMLLPMLPEELLLPLLSEELLR